MVSFGEVGRMLASMLRVVRAIWLRRRSMKLSQRRVAGGVGCSQSYLAQVETGKRPISRRFAERLESYLGVRPGSFTEVEFRRGRPAMSERALQALREIRRSRGEAPRQFRNLGKPEFPRKDGSRVLEDPLRDLSWKLGGRAELDVGALEDMRPETDDLWRRLGAIRYDSCSEKWLHVKLALAGAEAAGVSPRYVGCALPCADGRTGRDAGRRAFPAFVWRYEDIALAVFPQRCVVSQMTHRWPDNLVVAARGGRRVTGIVEVDGRSNHQDQKKEKMRDRDLGVPILHLDADDLGRSGLMDRLLSWLRGLFAP